MVQRTKTVDISGDDQAILEARNKAVSSMGTQTHVGGVTISGGQSFVLPDGREIIMGPPGGGVIRKIALLLGDGEGNVGLMLAWLKAIMYVRSVGGGPVSQVNSILDAQRIADLLGDQGEEIVMSAYQEYWPSVSVKDLVVLKK